MAKVNFNCDSGANSDMSKTDEVKVIYRFSPTDIYEFAGWLTTRSETLIVGAEHKCYPIAEAVGEYLKAFPERFTAPPLHDRVQELERELTAVTAERNAFLSMVKILEVLVKEAT